MAFLWLGIEDNSVAPAVVLALGLCLITALLWLISRHGGRTLPWRHVLVGAAVLGVLIGLSTSLAGALLMVLKNGMHGHAFPDYPPGLIIEIVQRAPLWGLAGGFAGLGLALVWRALRP
jgi:hypothetical protein